MRSRIVVPAKFRALRADRGFTQASLARAAQMSRSYIKLIEREDGGTQPSDPFAVALAAVLGCTVEDFSDPKPDQQDQGAA